MKKAIFLEFSYPLWVEVAKQLKQTNDIEPIYWVSSRKIGQGLKDAFPNVIWHSTYDAVRALPAKEFSNLNPVAIDKEIVERLAMCEWTALRMMDRMDSGEAFPFRERVRLYLRLVQYWMSVLTQLRPDFVFFPTAPHLVFDYVAYEICKMFSIKTLMFERAWEDFLYPVSQFENSSREILDEYQNERPPLDPLSRYTQEEIKRVSAVTDYSRPYYQADLMQKYKRDAAWLSVLKKIGSVHRYGHYTKRALDILFGQMTDQYLKLKGCPVEEDSLSKFKFIWINRFVAERTKARLLAEYKKFETPPDYSKPYIYVALHYQPERSTVPAGGVYENQLVLIDLISKCKPEGWSIYVKEHITQFKHYAQGERGRYHGFYSDLAAIKDVVIIPRDTPSFKLIDFSQCVATVTGTVGLESIIRGKAVLVFGWCWYRDCEGAFPITSAESCRNAFEKIANGYNVQASKVIEYMKIFEKFSIRGFVEPTISERAGLTNEENNHSLAQALSRKIHQGLYNEVVK